MIVQSQTDTKRLPTRLLLAAVAAGALLAPLPAVAFTFQDGQGNTIPKFDLDEQTRQFRKPDVSDATKNAIDTPVGKLQFGVEPRDRSMFGSAFGSPFTSPHGFRSSGNADRRHYERLFAPDAMKNLYD